jgi:excinuclease ABC subunit C
MFEALTRRFKRGKEENDLPDLLVVDGGKGHLNLALKVLAELNIISVDVISLAKEAGRHDKGMTQEQLFLPNLKDPIRLNKTSPLLFLLQKIRDEAHRFAITYHRKKRTATTLKSTLDELPGIGPVKKKNILKHFGSLKQLLQASPDDLSQVKGLTAANIETLTAFIKKELHS